MIDSMGCWILHVHQREFRVIKGWPQAHIQTLFMKIANSNMMHTTAAAVTALVIVMIAAYDWLYHYRCYI